MVTVRYLVHNVDSAVAFYRDRFGFKLEQQFGAAMAIMEHDELALVAGGAGRIGVAADAGRTQARSGRLEQVRARGRRS